MNDRTLRLFVGPNFFELVRNNGHSLLPIYNQRTSAALDHSADGTTLRTRRLLSRPPAAATSFPQRDQRLGDDGHFIYVCMGGQVFCRLIELDAKDFENDEDFLRELHDCCSSHWSQLLLLFTMSASDQVHLKQFHFMTNGPIVRCSRTSSLPPTTHEQYRHQGADITFREDMIVHDLRKYARRQWYGQSSDAISDRICSGQHRIVLDAIPKKVPDRLVYLKGREGWGLHISLRLCYYRLAICMAGWMIASSVSVALLLNRQAASLQDAFVPAGISLTLFLFYVGLMTGLRK